MASPALSNRLWKRFGLQCLTRVHPESPITRFPPWRIGVNLTGLLPFGLRYRSMNGLGKPHRNYNPSHSPFDTSQETVITTWVLFLANALQRRRRGLLRSVRTGGLSVTSWFSVRGEVSNHERKYFCKSLDSRMIVQLLFAFYQFVCYTIQFWESPMTPAAIWSAPRR